MDLFLQIFLYANVFVIGGLVVYAVMHAHAHYRPHSHQTLAPDPAPAVLAATPPAPSPNRLPPAIKERMLATAQANFETAVGRSTAELQRDLSATADRLNRMLDKLGSDMISDESGRYKAVLQQLRTQAEVGISGMGQELSEHRAGLQAAATAEVEARKQQLLTQIDTKLADAVISFLIETMQYEVDLGAQTPYLLQTLDTHKSELKKGISDEV